MPSHADNHWRALLPRVSPEDFVPCERVSVVIPYFSALDNLRLAIAALHNQTYPQHLAEIIVVDDGSGPPLSAGDIPGGIRIVRQERDGRVTARARHGAALEATGSILVFIDGDVILRPDNLLEHARWHTAGSHIFSFGDLLVIDSDQSIPHRRLDWHRNVRRWTRDCTRGDDSLFSFIAGYNYAVNRDMYWRWDLGKHSERFKHWALKTAT